MDQELASVLAVDECVWLVLEYAFDYPLIRHLLNRGGATMAACIKRASLDDFPMLITGVSMPVCGQMLLQYESRLPREVRCIAHFGTKRNVDQEIKFSAAKFRQSAYYEKLCGWINAACACHRNDIVAWLLDIIINPACIKYDESLLLNLAHEAVLADNYEIIENIITDHEKLIEHVDRIDRLDMIDYKSIKFICVVGGIDRQYIIKNSVVARICLRGELRIARLVASDFSITAHDLADKAAGVLVQLCLAAVQGPEWLLIAQWWAELTEVTASAFSATGWTRTKMSERGAQWISQWFGLSPA